MRKNSSDSSYLKASKQLCSLSYIDTHCHLEVEEFQEDLVEVVKRADDLGIHIITSGIDPRLWSRALSISELFGNVSASVGLDPLLCEYKDSLLDLIDRNRNSLVSVGEVGLDHYRERDHSQREKQAKTFRCLIRKAIELNLPVQVHSRSAGKAALDILVSEEAPLVHMHAFDGKASLARNASREYGFYFSIPCSVVRSPQKQKLTRAVDIERLLLETDSPVLGPDKQTRNEPANIRFGLEKAAELLNRNAEELREIILENALRLYKRIEPW